jgi:predicted transcriptional regulator
MLGRDMLFSCQEWKQLSPAAKLVYIYLKAKHNGRNNGEICLHYSELETSRGLGSPSTVSKAFKELEKAGWIRKTKHGGLYRYQNLYELTGRYDHWIADSRPVGMADYKKTPILEVSKDPPTLQNPKKGKADPGEPAEPGVTVSSKNEESHSTSRS